MKIISEGVNYDDCFVFQNDLTITTGFNDDDNSIIIDSSSEFTAQGDAYDLIDEKIWSKGCAGRFNEIPTTLNLPFCCTDVDGFIGADGLSIDECNKIARGQWSNRRDDDCLNYLCNVVYWQNGFDEAYQHPKVPYCTRPSGVDLTLLRLINNPLFIGLGLGIPLIIGGLVTGNTKADYEDALMGSGRYHIGFYLKDFIDHHIRKECGLEIQSTSFLGKDPYNNYVYLIAPNVQGPTIKEDKNWNHDNNVDKTIKEILDEVSLYHNLQYFIHDGVFYWERVDVLDSKVNNCSEVSLEDYFKDDCAFSAPVFGYDFEDQCANRKLSATQDTCDTSDGENYDKFHFRVDYTNDGEKKFLRGQCDHDFVFSPTKGSLESILDRPLDAIRNTNRFGNRNYRHELCLSQGLACMPKLLVIDPALEENWNGLRMQFMERKSNGDYFHYNYHSWLDPETCPGENVYDCFWSQKDPCNDETCRRVDNFTFDTTDCDLIKLLLTDPIFTAISTEYGKAKFKNYALTFYNQMVRVTATENYVIIPD